MRHFFLLFFVFTTISVGFAQSNFQPAQVTTTEGTTLEGFIDYDNWEKTPDQITFKVALNGKVTSYQPKDIQGFSLNEITYVSALIEIDTNSRENGKLSYSKDLDLISIRVFMKQLVEGDKGLYVYVDRTAMEHFFLHDLVTYELLIYKRFLEREDYGAEGNPGLYYLWLNQKSNKVNHDKSYKKQLLSFLEKCPYAKKYVRLTNYNEKSLLELFQKYNACFNLSRKEQRMQKRLGKEVGFLVGPSIINMNFSVHGKQHLFYERTIMNVLADTPFETQKTISGGLFLNHVLPSYEKLIFTSELFYHGFKLQAILDETSPSGARENKHTFDLGYKYISLNIGIKHHFIPDLKNTFYLGTSFLSSFLIDDQPNERHYQSWLRKDIEVDKITVGVPGLKKRQHGVLLRIGFQTKHIIIETRGEFRTKIAADIPINFTTIYSLLIGFKL